jgi:hypothetical protein
VKKEDRVKSAQEHFKANPKVELFHVTGDGQCFTRLDDALAHARTLEDKEVLEVEKKSTKQDTSGSEGAKVVNLPEGAKAYDDITVQELQEYLNSIDVAFEAKAKKQELFNVYLAKMSQGAKSEE